MLGLFHKIEASDVNKLRFVLNLSLSDFGLACCRYSMEFELKVFHEIGALDVNKLRPWRVIGDAVSLQEVVA
ncbi:hypothetical protein P8452_37481 [Trifolium repens]|nr:hypothetical protein P8452_37481 [Trifolium repens]